MRFSLVLRGVIAPTGNKPNRGVKWRIREQVDVQMRELWRLTPLKTIDKFLDENYLPNGCYLGRKLGAAAGYAPVSKRIFTCCDLEILFLDPVHEWNSVRDDIDNVAKTVVDGLTLPSQKAPPGTFVDHRPDRRVFSVMDDDNLVRRIGYRRERLLGADGRREEAIALVEVSIAATETRLCNMGISS